MILTVANGNRTINTVICSQLQWSMQGHHFVEDLRILPLRGCDIELCADWLKILCDVLFNLSKYFFQVQRQQITLHDTSLKPSLLLMCSVAIKKYFSKNSHGMVGHMFSISTNITPPSTNAILLPL